MKRSILLLLLCITVIYNKAAAQANTLNGVYAGIRLVVSPLIGGGMNRDDIVILFRPDGTLNDQMDKPDWKTRITGNYQISGSKVLIKFTRGRTDDYTIKNDDKLDGGGYYLFKLNGTAIPAGYYEFKSASGSGGGVSGLAYVGASSNTGLNFDGKGNFSHSRSSAVMVSGDNIGGGSTKKSSGNGTYKIDHGTLTLSYSNGKTELHTFFCRPHDQHHMAAIDGDIYFMKDEKEDEPALSKDNTSQAGSSASSTAKGSTSIPGAIDGRSLLLKANDAHGGNSLDMMKTARLSATIMGLKAVELIDIAGKKVRVELWKNGKLASVEQTEGNSGWKWANGNKTNLSADRLAEMKSTLYSGLLGLRKPVLNQMQVIGTQKLKNGGYSVLCRMDGNDYIFAINDQNLLTAYGNKTAGKTSVALLSDLRPVQGITIPFHETLTSGLQKLSIQYDNCDINPDLDDNNWAIPTGN